VSSDQLFSLFFRCDCVVAMSTLTELLELSLDEKTIIAEYIWCVRNLCFESLLSLQVLPSFLPDLEISVFR
jgi:hypothetical protein